MFELETILSGGTIVPHGFYYSYSGKTTVENVENEPLKKIHSIWVEETTRERQTQINSSSPFLILLTWEK